MTRKGGIQFTIVALIALASATASTIAGQPEKAAERSKPRTQYIGSRPDADVAATRAYGANLKALFVSMPRPQYPPQALRQRQTGKGVLRLYIAESGTVTDVKVMKSTGHRLLDGEGVRAFRQWQARPGPRREVDMPLTFMIPDTSVGKRRNDLSPELQSLVRASGGFDP